MTLSLDSARDALALPIAGALLEELAVLIAEQDLLSDDEYDPELDVDPTDAEYALDFGDTGSGDPNNLGAAAYALNAGMPAISWRQARKNARERENAKKAARQFQTYSMAQYALYATGRITLDVLNARILASFRKQARNAFTAGRRTMGLYQSTSADDEAALQVLLTVDQSDLENAIDAQNRGDNAGIFTRANNAYNQYQNVEMAKGYGEKLLGRGEEDAKKGLQDFAKDFGLKGAAAVGFVGAEKLDAAAGYQEGWNQVSEHLDRYGNVVENYGQAGEMNAMGVLPTDTVLVWWRLGAADHCDDCIALSDASPLYLSVLDQDGIFPGSGHTQCGGNCHCDLEYETPDQVCGDTFADTAGDPSLTLMESAGGGRMNVYIMEADACANPIDLASMDVADQGALDSADAYNWDEDIQNTFEGDVVDTAQTMDASALDIQKLFGFLNNLVPPDALGDVRISELHDAATTYKVAWRETADAIVYHAGLVAKGPAALEHEFTLRSLAQLSALAKEKGKALAIDGHAVSPGMRKWLDALGAEHKFDGAELASLKPAFPAVYIPPKDLYVPSHITLGVSRMRPELGSAQTLDEVNALHNKSVILDAEATTLSDLKNLKVATEGQQEVIGRYTLGDVSGGEPSLLVSLNAHKVDLADVDIAGAYLVRRNLQDSVVATFTGDEMKRMGLSKNGYLLTVTGLPVNKMQEVYDAVGKLVPVASIDAIHGVVEFSVFEADVTTELKNGFAAIANTFPGAKFGLQDAHVRWYFHDAETRAAVDYLHGPAEDLLTADEVIAANSGDLRTLAIPGNRGADVGQVAGGVAGTSAAAVEGYGLGRPEEDLRNLLAAPFSDGSDQAATKAVADHYEAAYKAWHASLTDVERGQLGNYQIGGSDSVNAWLRAGSPKGQADLLTAMAKTTGEALGREPVADYAAQVARLDSAIAKGAIPDPLLATGLKEPTLTFRGISGQFATPKVGDILSDKAYVSTTLDPAQGVKFAAVLPPEKGESQILYRYALPAGFNAAYMDSFFDKAFNDEREMLLGRDTRFRVVAVEKDVPVTLQLPVTKSGPGGKLVTEMVPQAGRTVTVVDLVPEANIEYRQSEDWLKTVKPHFIPPPLADLTLDTSGVKLGGLTAKAIYTDKGGQKYLFKPKKVFLKDIGLSQDSANVEKTADYIADMLKLDVKPVEPYVADFPFPGKAVAAVKPVPVGNAEKALVDELQTAVEQVPSENRALVLADGAFYRDMAPDSELPFEGQLNFCTYNVGRAIEQGLPEGWRVGVGYWSEGSGHTWLVDNLGRVVDPTSTKVAPRLGFTMPADFAKKFVVAVSDDAKAETGSGFNFNSFEALRAHRAAAQVDLVATGGNIQKLVDDVKPLTAALESPVPVEPTFFKPPASPIPTGDLKKVKGLGGSTGATLVEDPLTGIQYVDKFGASAGHVTEEYTADRTYEAMGFPVSRSALQTTAQGPMKRATYIEGVPLASWWGKADTAAKAAMREQLQAGMAMDALMANWDVLGMAGDNVLIDKAGKAWRIDNGGALRYKAMGSPKGALFGDKVTELKLWRVSQTGTPSSAKEWARLMYGDVSSGELARQVEVLDAHRAELLAALPDDLKPTISARLDDMKAQLKGIAPAEAKPGLWGAVEDAGPVDPNMAVIDALTPTQVTQLGQHQIFDWLVGNDDGHIGQWLIDGKDGHIIGIDKDAAIWELPAQMAAGNITMDEGKGYARAIFDNPTTARLAKLDPAAIGDTLNRASHITDAQYIEMFKPVIPVLMAHPNAVKLSEEDWMGVILKRKHELRFDVDSYYANHIEKMVKDGIVLPPKWAEWRATGSHFASDTDVKSALHLEAKGPAIPEPKGTRKEGVGWKPLDQQQYMVGGSPIPLNAPLPAWSGFVPDEPPLPPIKATPEQLDAARAEAHAVFRDVPGVMKGDYPIGISVTPKDSVDAEAAGLVGGKFSGIRLYAKNEADLQPIKDYLAIPGHTSFDAEFDHLIGYSDADIAKLDAYDNAKKGMSLRAGAVVIEPDGRVWVIAPNNKFGGYVNTWVKGGVEGDASTALTAVREVREETGIGVELDGFLGDYPNKEGTSISRMYVAHRVGGGPLYVSTPKETYKVKLMNPEQAKANLIRTSGHPDPRDQLILTDALAKVNGKAGDLTYVVPADDVGQFHKAIALTKSDEAVPSVLPSAVPPIDFSTNPVTIDVVKPGVAFTFDPAKVAGMQGTETDYKGSTKAFPFNTTKWPSTTGDQKMFWKPSQGGVFWANSKAQLADPFERMNVHAAQMRKFGEMFATDAGLADLTISNALLDQVPGLKDMVKGVNAYTPGLKDSKLTRAQVGKLLDVTKGVPLDKASEAVRVPTAPHDPVAKLVGRSGVDVSKVSEHLASVEVTPVVSTIAAPPSLVDLKKLDMAERKASFAALPVETRDAMANAVETVPAAVKTISDMLGPLTPDADAIFGIQERDAQLAKAGIVTPAARAQVRNYAFELRDDLYAAGVVDKKLLHDLVLDTYDSMLAQEAATMTQVLGDHGARHIIGDFNTAWDVLKVVPGNDDAVTKALLKLTAPFHDLGYLTPTGRMFLTADHERWGQQAFDAMLRPNIEKAFSKHAADEMAQVILTHAEDTLDWTGDPLGSAFRLGDNLALFEKEKLPALIAYVPGNQKVLIDYAEGVIGLPKAQMLLQDNIGAANLTAAVKDQLMSAVGEVGPTLPKFTIGMFGGHIGNIGWDADHVTVELVRGEANEALAKVVDVGQNQFAKFAHSYGLDGKAFVDDGHFEFKNASGKTQLTATVVTPKGVLVDRADLLAVTDPDTAAMATAISTVQTTGPPNVFGALPEESFKWNLPDVVTQPTTGTLYNFAGTENLFVGGSVAHLDAPTQLNVLAATLAKMNIAADRKTITVGGSLTFGDDSKLWLKKTFGIVQSPGSTNMEAIPVEKVKAWRASLAADLHDHGVDIKVMDPIEHAEPVGTGVIPGQVATKYAVNVDLAASLTDGIPVAFTTDSGNLATSVLWTSPSGNGAKALFKMKGTTGVDWYSTSAGGVYGGIDIDTRKAAMWRQLKWFGDYAEQHPNIENLSVGGVAVSGAAGTQMRKFLTEFEGVSQGDMGEFTLDRATLLSIRDQLDKELVAHAVPEAIPEAGLAHLFPHAAPSDIVQTAPGSWTLSGFAKLHQDANGMLHYYAETAPDHGVVRTITERQVSDLIAMRPMVAGSTMPMVALYSLDPEVAKAMTAYGGVTSGLSTVMPHDGYIKFVDSLTTSTAAEKVAIAAIENPTLTTKSVLDAFGAQTKDKLNALLAATPNKDELLPNYKTYSKGEIQLRKTTYGQTFGTSTNEFVWRRWGNRIELWDAKGAPSAQLAYLVNTAKTMEAFPKIEYLRVLKPDMLGDKTVTMLYGAGAKAYDGGLRIERAQLLKVRDQLMTDLGAAAAVAPKATEVPHILDAIVLGSAHDLQTEIETTNALTFASTVPDKYKFTWATYTSPSDLSAKVVTRTSKSELWWRYIQAGPVSSGENTRRAVLREMVRQGDEFEKNPGWLRMRLTGTGLSGLTPEFRQVLKDKYGAEVLDATTWHVSRDNVLKLRDDLKHDLGMTVTKAAEPAVAVLKGVDSNLVLDQLGTTAWHMGAAGNILNYTTEPVPTGWAAKFESGTKLLYHSAGVTGDDLMVDSVLWGASDPTTRGTEFASYLTKTSGVMVKTQRDLMLGPTILQTFPEFRDRLIAAGAQMDKGYLRLSPEVSGKLSTALAKNEAIAIEKPVVAASTAGVKLSAQLGYDKAELDALHSNIAGSILTTGPAGTYSSILTVKGDEVLVEPYGAPVDAAGAKVPLAQLAKLSASFEPGASFDALHGIHFTQAWVQWAGSGVEDLLKASNTVPDGSGGYFMHRVYLSKLAAKITDDVGVDVKVLEGSAAATELLAQKPLIVDLFPAAAYHPDPWKAEDLNKFIGQATMSVTGDDTRALAFAGGPTYDIRFAVGGGLSTNGVKPTEVWVEDFAMGGAGKAVEVYAGDIAMASWVADSIAYQKSIDRIAFIKGSEAQQNWLKAFGAIQHPDKVAYLLMDRDQVLAMKAAIDAQLVGKTEDVVSAAVSPNLEALLSAVKTDADSVAYMGTEWLDTVVPNSTGGGYVKHEATIAGTLKFNWVKAPSAITWTDTVGLGPATAKDIAAGQMAALKVMLNNLEADPDLHRILISPAGLYTTTFKEALKTVGAVPAGFGYLDTLKLERPEALKLKALLEGVPPAGVMGSLDAHAVIADADISKAAVVGLPLANNSTQFMPSNFIGTPPTGFTDVQVFGKAAITYKFDYTGPETIMYAFAGAAPDATQVDKMASLIALMKEDIGLSSTANIDKELLAQTGLKDFILAHGGYEVPGGVAVESSEKKGLVAAFEEEAKKASLAPVDLSAVGLSKVDLAAVKTIGLGNYNSTLGGILFPDDIGIEYTSETGMANSFGVPKTDNTVIYAAVKKSDGDLSGLGTWSDVTGPQATEHVLADIHHDFTVTFGVAIDQQHDVVFTNHVLVQSAGLKDIVTAYGATETPITGGFLLTSQGAKALADDIEAGTLKGVTAAIEAAPVVVHTSVGSKYGFDLATAKTMSMGGSISGGKLSKNVDWREVGGGYSSPRLHAVWSELTGMVRWDVQNYTSTYYGALTDAQKEAAQYRHIGLLVKRAAMEGKGLGVKADIVKEDPKIAALLKGYGAKEKALGGKAQAATDVKDLLLNPEQVASLDSAIEREKAGALFAAVPTTEGFTSGLPMSKQAFGMNPEAIAKVTYIETLPGQKVGYYSSLSGVGWSTAKFDVPSYWSGKGEGYFIYKAVDEPIYGHVLTIGMVTAPTDILSVVYKHLPVLFDEEAAAGHPVEALRVRSGILGNAQSKLFKSLGGSYDETSGYWFLNKAQTELLVNSIKEDKVLWDPATGYKAAEALKHEPPPLPVAKVADKVQPVMAPAPVIPPPVPTPVLGTGLAASYGYDAAKVDDMVTKYAISGAGFEGKVLSVGKYGPSLEDTWQVAPGLGSVKVKWSFDDHKGTRIAHIRQVIGTGNVENQTTALIATFRQRFLADMFVDHPELSRVIVDKKALVGNPKMEQMLKDAGWKETKAYWTTDKAGLSSFVEATKADKAPWLAAPAIGHVVSAVPAGAGLAATGAVSQGFVIPSAISSKLAKPSFIYDFDKATADNAFGAMAQTDLGIVTSLGGDAQTYQLGVLGTTGKWSVSPSGKTVGWFEFTATGNGAVDSASAMAMLRKVAEDAQNRTDKFWVKPDVYDKVPGLRQLLLDAGGTEAAYPKLGTAIEMKASNASVLISAISGDSMVGLKVSVKTPADYLLFDKGTAITLFTKPPIVEDARGATWSVYKVGNIHEDYTVADRQATWTSMTGDIKETAGLAAVAQLEWFNEQGVPNVLIKKEVLAQVPKLSQFLIAAGGTVEADAIRLDASALNNVAKFLHHESLPEALGGAKLPYSLVDDMAAKSTSVVEALHAVVVEPDALAQKATWTLNGTDIVSNFTRTDTNIYWRGVPITGSAGQMRAVAVAQLRQFTTDIAQNGSIARLDVDARVFNSVPHVKDVLKKFGATEEHGADGAVYWSLDRARADKLRQAIDAEIGDVLAGPAGYAMEQVRVVKWPSADDLVQAHPNMLAAQGVADGKTLFVDKDANSWLFRPASQGQEYADKAASDLATLLGLPMPSVKLYTLNLARPGEAEHFVTGSLAKQLPSVKPVVLGQLTPMQMQDILRQSVLDWVTANDDAHAASLIINGADDKVWSLDKSKAWLNLKGPQDILDRNASGTKGGTPVLFKFMQEAVGDPSKLSLVHPTTLSVTLRHLQAISDDEFIRIVTPVASRSQNPLFKGQTDKFIAAMLDRKHGAASDFEAFFRRNIKDAMVTDEAKVPAEWKTWLAKGGTFDLDATPQDLWKERMGELDAKWQDKAFTNGVWDAQKFNQTLDSQVYSPIRRELDSYFGSGATMKVKGYGGETVRPYLEKKGLAQAMADWQELQQLGLLHIVSGDAGPVSARMDSTLRKFFNPETGTFRVIHSTNRYGGQNAQKYVDHYTKEGVRDFLSTSIGTHVTIAGGGGVYYYIDLPYDQLFSSKALGRGAEGDEITAIDVRPEQIIAVRPQNSPMDLTKLLDYDGPVVSSVNP